MKAVVAAFVDRKQNKRERGGPAEIAYYRRKERERSLCVSVRVLFNIRSSKQVGRRAPSWFEKKYAFFYSSRRLDRSIRTHTHNTALSLQCCVYVYTHMQTLPSSMWLQCSVFFGELIDEYLTNEIIRPLRCFFFFLFFL